MMANVADEIKKLVRARSGKPAIESLKKGEDIKPEPGKRGGARPGSGRKPTEASELRRNHLQFIREHANELVPVKVEDKKTGKSKIIKMKRIAVVMEMLFGQVQAKEGWAVREYLDRVLGKAMQPIGGDEDEPIVLRIDF